MGTEYRISCAPEALPRIAELLCRLGGQRSVETPPQIEFRFRPDRPAESPDVTVVVESESIYFLDHCGDRQQSALLFRQVIDCALKFSDSSDSVVITSL